MNDPRILVFLIESFYIFYVYAKSRVFRDRPGDGLIAAFPDMNFNITASYSGVVIHLKDCQESKLLFIELDRL